MNDELIYVEQPHDWEVNSNLICRLLRALYDLKQAPMLQQKTLQSFIKKYGFSPSPADPYLYTRNELIVAVQINDILAVTTTNDELNQLIQLLETEYKIKDIGQPSSFIKIAIRWDRKTEVLTLS